MLDLILAWAHLDGALSMLVAIKFGLEPTKAALLLGRANGSDKLKHLQTVFKFEGDEKSAAQMKSLRKAYDNNVAPRNLVAHASCRGYLSSDPQMIVFAKFEAVDHDQMAIYLQPIGVMQQSTTWANKCAGVIETLTNLYDTKPA
ncbi:hypothetical protein [Novosphingobium tardum]